MLPVERYLAFDADTEQQRVDEELLATDRALQAQRRPTTHQPYVWRLQAWIKFLTKLGPGLLHRIDARFDVAHDHAPETATGANQLATPRNADTLAALHHGQNDLRTLHAQAPRFL